MKRYDLITPEGTRDLLFEGCLARRMVEDRLSKLFEGFGYSEVVGRGGGFCGLWLGWAGTHRLKGQTYRYAS